MVSGLIYQHGLYCSTPECRKPRPSVQAQKLDFYHQGLDFRIKGSYNSDYTQQKARTTSGGISYKGHHR